MPVADLLPRSDREAVGRRIRVHRCLLELTQGALAARLFVSQPAVSAWERGAWLPSTALQYRLADELRVPRSQLFREVALAESAAVA